MSVDTRQKILHIAKQLFNEREINEVSIADIASSVGISKGNLTYYFARKEAIVEALVLESTTMPPLQLASSLGGLLSLIEHMQSVVQDNAYYFRHYAQIAQMIPRVAQQQRKVFSFFRAVMMQSFMNLGELGLVDQSKKPEEFDSVIDAVFMTCVFWLPFSELKGKSSQANGLTQCEFYLKAILTEEGLQELNKVHG